MSIEQPLSSVLREFARTLSSDVPVQTILDQLVVRIVETLPVLGAGVTLNSPGRAPFTAASEDLSLGLQHLQRELGEGPCLAAYETGEPVVVTDLRTDVRFPRFSPRAVQEGVLAVFTFPIGLDDAREGSLDLYRGEAGPLDGEAAAAAEVLADVAAAYLRNARARAELTETVRHEAEGWRPSAPARPARPPSSTPPWMR